MNKLSWDTLQRRSDEILSDGLFKLKTQPYSDDSSILDTVSGNYLLSLDKKPYYIGEAKELKKRLKQQFKLTTTTFYKNFQKLYDANRLIESMPIDSFNVQTILTLIGRKEIEEFGIVNLPTILNSFQLNKRKKFSIKDQNGLWDRVQQSSNDLIKEGEEKILNNKFTSWLTSDRPVNAGLYLVKSNSDKLIYVGESSDVGERIATHSGRTYFSALRRHIGTEILKFQLQEINGRKRYFSDSEDRKVTDFLRSCKVTTFAASFGRYELEEFLIKKYHPMLNRKDNQD
jgi:predicted GIY-YIG superfamily endonuclease